MNFYVLGINHYTAPVAVRESLAFDPATLGQRLELLVAQPGVAEAVILSTCNRTEVYAVLDSEDVDLRHWLLKQSEAGAELESCLYTLRGDEAVSHGCEVACGLNSAILGEPQILGQMKDAYRLSQAQAAAGPATHRLFQHIFSVAKRVRTETTIGASSVSAASAAVDLARQLFAGFDRHTALFVGAGEMIELTMRHLASAGLARSIIANRSIGRAQELASEFDAMVIGLDQINSHLHEADLVVACTASPNVVIDVNTVRAALRRRRRKPMFLIDLAVPRDIDSGVAKFSDAYLYTVDDLRRVIDRNQAAREDAAVDARQLIGSETESFVRRHYALDAVPLIKSVRHQLGIVRDQALAQAQRQIAAGKPVDEVLERLADAITNRLLHEPSARLREAGEQGDRELLAVARKLFGVGSES